MATIYREGALGAMVKQIQKVVGCYPDGVWGRLTTEAVMAWQRSHGLTADGLVGPATLAKMGLSAIATSTVASRPPSGIQHGTVFLKRSRRTIKEIIIHCAATPEGKPFTVDDICRWHKQQGWATIGYHYVIHLDGSLHTGRDVDISGAHCSRGGHNTYSIGICYVGGVAADGKTAKDTRTPAQKRSLLSLLVDLKKLYPDAVIYGHHDFDPGKDCPSFNAKQEYSLL